MITEIETPYEFEALALYMGTTPKKAAQAVLEWFTQPLRESGLVHGGPDYSSPETFEIVQAAGAYAVAQGLDRGDALTAMREAA